MIQIPNSWKVGSGRETWLISQGSPVFLFQTKNLKLATRFFKYKNQNGFYEVYKEGLIRVDEIAEEIQIIVNESEFYGKGIFKDVIIYVVKDIDLSDCIGEDAEIYLTFNEVNGGTYEDVIKLFKGKITSIETTGGLQEVTIKPIFYYFNKRFPLRIDEFNQKYSLGWNLPKKSASLPVPIAFGHCYAKCILVKVISGANPTYYLLFNFPDLHPNQDFDLYYYDDGIKDLRRIGKSKWAWEKNTITDGEFQLVYFGLNDIGIEQGSYRYVRPFRGFNVGTIGALQEKMYDGRLADYLSDTQEYGWSSLGQGYSGYRKTHTLDYRKKDFDISVESDLYVMIGAKYPKWVSQATVKFDFAGIAEYEIPVSEWQIKGNHKWIRAVDTEYADDTGGLSNTHSPFFLIHMTPDDWENLQTWNDILSFHFYVWTDQSYDAALLTFECVIKQVLYTLSKDYYVYKSFGRDTVGHALLEIFNLAGLSGYVDIDIMDLFCDFQIIEFKRISEWLDEFAKNFGLIWYIKNGEKIYVRKLDSPPVYALITDDDIILEDGVRAFVIEEGRYDAFGSFIYDYDRDPQTKEYNFSKMNNVPDTEKISDNVMNIKGYMVRREGTAESVLNMLQELLKKRRKRITFKSALNLIDIEVGDFIRFNLSDFSPKNLYLVISKRVSNDFTIEFQVFETHLTTTRMDYVVSDDVNVVENISINKGAIINETVEVGENVVVVKETILPS